jgi:rRNA maturation endonuclease Nob1
MSSCLDLTAYQNSDEIAAVYSQIVSGKKGYKAVIERKREPLKCLKCLCILEGKEKFCPECGEKVKLPSSA